MKAIPTDTLIIYNVYKQVSSLSIMIWKKNKKSNIYAVLHLFNCVYRYMHVCTVRHRRNLVVDNANDIIKVLSFMHQ